MGDARIPVIDLFAGPGGLGEGFAAYVADDGSRPFRIALSIEKDGFAYQTLLVRSFYRQFAPGDVPEDYFRRLRGEISSEQLFSAHPEAAAAARGQTWRAALGDPVEAPVGEVRRRVRRALASAGAWVLIGGPPCQAYSLAGRSRNKGIDDYALERDPKSRLYVEYLQLIADFAPPVFIMENVRGLLSASAAGQNVFEQIRNDLLHPAAAIAAHGRRARPGRKYRYQLRALDPQELYDTPTNFVVRCERFGIPQARHRVIIVGVREDQARWPLLPLTPARAPTVEEIIRDLPKIRSGLSQEPDGPDQWIDAVLEMAGEEGISAISACGHDAICRGLAQLTSMRGAMARLDRGRDFVPGEPCVQYEREWFVDPRLQGFCNHSSRAHIRKDLHRYVFAAVFAEVYRRSAELDEFPRRLRPRHRNVLLALQGSNFADRFRVQHRHRHATTITSHISKDGHYYIHYDPMQCRSLTVREAARLQTFPDNYFFEGPRTSQYVQVGNAVPPLLARQIALRVYENLA